MTDAQVTAINQMLHIAREHFDASVIVVQGEAVVQEGITQEQADKCADIEYVFHGGYASSIGLVELARLHIWKRESDKSHTD